MYLYLIALLLLILITLYYYGRTREGMDPLDTPMIIATDTNVELPNIVSGIAGKDLTFMGNILMDKDKMVELGRGYDKGENAGKIRYNKDSVEIFGAGMDGNPHKIKLWDNVEVGDFLHVNNRANINGPLTFGKDEAGSEGGMHFDKQANQLAIMGYGKNGERKVKIWDEAEVGRLLTTKGMDVKGNLNAYNDLIVDGIIQSNGKMFAKDVTVIGDLDISGNLSNKRLDYINSSLVYLNQRIDDFDRPSIGAAIDDAKLQATNAVNALKQETTSNIKAARDEASQENTALRTSMNASLTTLISANEASHTRLNSSIQSAITSNENSIKNLSTTFTQAITDLQLANSSQIASFFKTVTDQIKNSDTDTNITTGELRGLIVGNTTAINNVSLIAADALLKANDWNAAKANMNASIKDAYEKANDWNNNKTNMNTSLTNAYTLANDWNANKSTMNTSINNAYTKAYDWDATKTNLNSSIKYAHDAAIGWNTSKASFATATAGWNASSKFFNDSANEWKNSSGSLISAMTDWNSQKSSLADWTSGKNVINNAVSSWNLEKELNYSAQEKTNLLWNASKSYGGTDLTIPNTITIGSGNKTWRLTPNETKLNITKV